MAFVAMNTPLDPASLARPPLHLVVAIEQSQWLVDNMASLKAGVVSIAQAGEAAPAVGVDTYRCHNCGRLEFYDHDFLLPSA